MAVEECPLRIGAPAKKWHMCHFFAPQYAPGNSPLAVFATILSPRFTMRRTERYALWSPSMVSPLSTAIKNDRHVPGCIAGRLPRT